MANPQYNQYSQQGRNMPPLQTQNHMQGQHPFSPPAYQQSPGAMSPTGGIPPAKRQRLSPQPGSPAYSPFSASPYQTPTYTTPYATSPTANQYLHPQSPSTMQSSHSFNQPQPYQHPQPNAMDPRPHPQGSMPPPKVPFSKMQDTGELEKANAKDLDVNNISDVLTGSGIDIRAEEEAMLHTVGSRNYGTSFNSQGTGSTLSPHGSFNQWGQQTGHGAYQGTGSVSQPVTQEQLEGELMQKHQRAARAANESSTLHLADPFLYAAALRQRIAKRAYEHGISVNLEGLFDKIPEHSPSNVGRTTMTGSDGGSIVGLQATSLLNQNAPLVELLSYISLAAQERMRTVVEDAFALAQGRRNTADGTVHPNLADIAAADGAYTTKTVVSPNLSKTAWEAAPDSAVSPTTVTAQKQLPSAARLPTPPSEAPPTPQPTVQITSNHVAQGLKRKFEEDKRLEKERINKRKKRVDGSSATPADTPTIAPLPPPEKITKKERDRLNKVGQSEEVLHRKANETASMALGFGKKSKKYSWMTGGGAGPSAPSTPKINTTVGTSGTSTPAQQPTDVKLIARRREFYGSTLEETPEAYKVQLRDLLHVLENDGRERKTLAQLLSRMRSTEKDEKTAANSAQPVSAAR